MQKPPAPSRPTIPYISVDDLHVDRYFRNDRIQTHLRRAGLLNRKGEILTQAEYDSKKTDVDIGRGNRKKYNEAIIEVLNDLGNERWAFTRDHMEDTKKRLYKEFRRIERQYRRRVQPVTIRHARDGEVVVQPDQSRTTHSRTPTNNPTEPHVSPSPTVSPQPDERMDFRDELNDLKNKLSSFDQRFDTLERRLDTHPVSMNIDRIEQRLTQLEILSGNFKDHLANASKKQSDEESIRALKEQINKLNGKKLDRQQISQIINGTEQKLQQQIQDLSGRFTNLLEEKPDHQTVKQLIQESVTRISQQINTLEQIVIDNEQALRKIQVDLKRLPQQPNKSSSRLLEIENKGKSVEDPLTNVLTPRELQAIMPYIERLPVFDMFNENEWI